MSDSSHVRVVLDTNILLSACLKSDGLEARVVGMTFEGTLELCVSEPIVAEYRDVLFRSKFAPIHTRAETLLGQTAKHWLMFLPVEKATAASDNDDNRFLECAQAASAPFLITGNLRHYPELHGTTRVLNARAFLTMHELE